MANEGNLKPIKQSNEEAMRNGSKGGIKSGKARRAKRDLRERFEIAFKILDKKALKNLKGTEERRIVKVVGTLGYKVLDIINSKKVKTETKLKAINTVWDRMYGKSKENIDHTTDGEKVEMIINIVDSKKEMERRKKERKR